MNILWKRAWCDTAPPILGSRSRLTVRSKVAYRKHTHSVQVWASLGDVGPIVPEGLGHWTHFFIGPSSRPSWTPDPMDTPQRESSIHTYIHTYIHVMKKITYNSVILLWNCLTFWYNDYFLSKITNPYLIFRPIQSVSSGNKPSLKKTPNGLNLRLLKKWLVLFIRILYQNMQLFDKFWALFGR